MENPISIDMYHPRLLWQIDTAEHSFVQKAYQVLVYNHGKEKVWDSGVVYSSDCYCDYNGNQLESMQSYFWHVRIMNGQDEWLPYSEPAIFETAILDEKLWQGKWIGHPAPSNFVGQFRRLLTVDSAVNKAKIFLATDGYSELWINGKKIGNNVLDPANVDCKKNVMYVTYDVTEYLMVGENAIGVRLAKGWSDHQKFLLQGYIWHENGMVSSFFSDTANWKLNISPLLSATIYSGEIYNCVYESPEWNLPGGEFEKKYHREDFRIFCDYLPERRSQNPAQYDQYRYAWYFPIELSAPEGELTSQMMEPIQPIEEIRPVAVHLLEDGQYVVDFGQNFAGWVRLTLKNQGENRITIRYTELLNEDKTLNMDYLRISDPTYPLPMQTDVYITDTDQEQVYEPSFTYHGFRYVGIEGLKGDLSLDNITGVVVHSAVKRSGEFVCENQLINQIQENIVWTERSNLYSIPTDCPQRSERQGWLNDLSARLEGSFYNFGLKQFYTKFERDIKGTQDMVSGAIADTAPFRRANKPADPVSSAYLLIPQYIYMHYADCRPISEHYEGMKKWTQFLYRNSEDGIVLYSFYGDWASPEKFCQHNGISSPLSGITAGRYISTGYLYLNVCLMIEFAKLLNHRDDEKYFLELKHHLKDRMNEVYFNPSTCQYSTGSQAANVFALYLDIVPGEYKTKVAENIVADVIEQDYHVSTGNLMSKHIYEVLTEQGYVDIAYKLASQTTYPSLGYMVEQGATTVWERWENKQGYDMNSHNHPMYGSICAWFYKYLAGMSPVKPGFLVSCIKPYIPKDLGYVKASYDTIYGKLTSEWRKQDGKLYMDVSIPAGTIGHVYIPVQNGTDEVEMDLSQAISVTRFDTCVLVKVASGNHHFAVAHAID